MEFSDERRSTQEEGPGKEKKKVKLKFTELQGWFVVYAFVVCFSQPALKFSPFLFPQGHIYLEDFNTFMTLNASVPVDHR